MNCLRTSLIHQQCVGEFIKRFLNKELIEMDLTYYSCYERIASIGSC